MATGNDFCPSLLVGYEIPFNRYYYQYQPPRALAEIYAVSAEIMKLLQEVHS